MSTIEERVVKITFDNGQFEKGVAQSRDSLGRFTKTLQLDGATKGLTDVGTAGTSLSSKLEAVFNKVKNSLTGTTTGLGEVDNAEKKISFQGLADGVDSIAHKFGAMSVIGITALSNIANKAVDAGISLVKSLTIDPIKDGFTNYETQINATQTILANTAAAGTTLKQVTSALAQLNTYANQTVYNFSDMTKNIGTFTAAGVKLKPAVEAIKGIANLAAMSGSTSEQASTAMYQLSQAMAAGVVHLQDWNSVVNAGLGGKTFQTALENTARASGVAIDSIIAKQGGFRNSLQKGWLTSDILSKTLSQFTGDLSLKQIEAMGYTAKQAQGILALGKVAVDSATKIKTMTQLSQALKEEVATAYAAIFKTIFGGIGSATELFSNVHNVLENAITGPIYAINTLLQGWDKLGGRTVIIKAIGNAFNAVVAVIHAVTSAFREVFPPTTAKQLYDFSVSLEQFTEKLKMGGKTADELKRTFAGVFAVLDIGWQIVKKVAETIGGLFTSATAGSGGILKFTASVGDWLVHLDQAIKKGQDLNNFFSGLQKYLTVPIQMLRDIGNYLGAVFGKFDAAKTQKDLAGVTAKLSPLAALGKIIDTAWTRLIALLPGIGKALEPLAQKVGKFFTDLAASIGSVFKGLSFNDVLHTIDTLLLGGIVLLFKNFLGKLTGTLGGGGGLLHAVTESFDELTKTLHTMQGTLKAATLLEIAVAIGILTVSVSVLSKIDSAGLTRSLTAMGIMMGELMGSMVIFQKVVGSTGFLKMPILATSFILLAIAIDLLVGALVKMSKLNLPDLIKGLKGLAALLLELVGTVKLMPPSSGMISTSIGLVILASGVRILVKAVTELSGLSWTELQKGLIGVGGLLAALALFTKFAAADKGGIIQGAGIILLAVGIRILASAMKEFGQFSWTEIGKGLVVLAGSLVAIGAALILIPPSSVLSAAAVLIVAASLSLLATALESMGKMSWSSIAKSLVELGGALVIIAVACILMTEALPGAAALLVVAFSLGMIAKALAEMGQMSWQSIAKSLVELFGSLLFITAAMILMTEALPGAAALLVVAASLQVLLPVLQAFGQMSWSEIGKSLLMLAGVFVILGVAGVVLTPVIPTLIGLGLAVTLLGIGMLAAGAGILLFSVALTALSISGAAGAAAIVAIVAGLIGLIPLVMKEIGIGLNLFAKVIGQSGPAILSAITTVLEALLHAIIKVIPDVVTTLLKLLTMLLDTLNKYVPHLIDAGGKLITAILNGIAARIGGIVAAAVSVIVNFINGVAAGLPRIIQSGVNLILSFINGVANAIRNNSSAMGAAGANLATAIVQGMYNGMVGGVGKLISEAENMAGSILSAAKHVLDSHSPSREFIKVGQSVGDGFLIGMKSMDKGKIDAAFTGLKNSLATAINDSGRTADALALKLKNLENARHKNRAEIAATKAELAEANKEHAKESAAYTELTKKLTALHTTQDKLATQYAALTVKIKDANTALADAIKTRDDYNKSIHDQYDTLPALTATTTVTSFTDELKTKIEKTKEFANALQRARKLGLNDEMYKELLAAGVDELPFVQNIIDSGKSGVDQINSLGTQLDAASTSLGKTASSDLYQAAVDSAAGLVKGLENQQAAIEKQMEKIADAMVAAIKKKLGIKSPSTVLAQVGVFSGQGVVDGLDSTADAVGRSAEAIGQTAISTLSKSLSGMSKLATANMDIRPTITPVLDLTSVKKDALTIGGLLAPQPLSVDAAYNKALAVAAGSMTDGSAAAKAAVDAKTNPTATAPQVTYIQNNNSPAALSAAEIYRQTKNQLSTVKGVLAFNVVQSGSQNQPG